MQLNPYLTFSGQCEEAFRFYAKTLGSRFDGGMKHGDSPVCDEIPPEWHDKVMHAQMDIGNAVLMGADAPPDYSEPMKGFSVALLVDTPEEAERIYAAFAEGGQVHMPLEETFWALRFGMVTDRFGTPWNINCLRADCPD